MLECLNHYLGGGRMVVIGKLMNKKVWKKN
jgi:hypothetical protein